MGAIVNNKDIKALSRLDPVFKYILKECGPPPEWERPPGFSSLVRIILEQQVSLASAKNSYDLLKNLYERLDPTFLVNISDEEAKRCAVTRQKAGYIRALSDALISDRLDLDQLAKLPTDEVQQQLISIKGIGPWTSSIYMMFCLKTKDIFPPGDIALINSIKNLKPSLNHDLLPQVIASWSPYRTLSAFFLWHHYLHSRGRKAIY